MGIPIIGIVVFWGLHWGTNFSRKLPYMHVPVLKYDGIVLKQEECAGIHSRKLTWKPKKGPTKTAVLLKGDYVGFHVSLGECILVGQESQRAQKRSMPTARTPSLVPLQRFPKTTLSPKP